MTFAQFSNALQSEQILRGELHPEGRLQLSDQFEMSD